MVSPVLLQVQGVSRRYRDTTAGRGGDHVAVNDVSLDIAAGEFFALLGPSGCGKTTLLRSIAGFETPDAGRILIDGVDITNHAPNRRPVNLVFQHYALFPHLTVEQNIRFGLRYQGVRGKEAKVKSAAVLERVQLTGLENRKPHQLSGGQKQRVALARALILQPKVLLLDEPLSALDQKLRRQMQVELKHLQKSLGITFVFVTHDQEEALIMSDRIGVMNAGVLEQVGPAAEVYERPSTEFVARFMGADNFFHRDGQLFVVRPEKLQLRRSDHQPTSCDRSEQVVIQDRLYQGISTTILVKNDRGVRYAVCLQNEAGSEVHGLLAGQRAFMTWCSNHEVPIRREISADQ